MIAKLLQANGRYLALVILDRRGGLYQHERHGAQRRPGHHAVVCQRFKFSSPAQARLASRR
jgi:hypothetical protein